MTPIDAPIDVLQLKQGTLLRSMYTVYLSNSSTLIRNNNKGVYKQTCVNSNDVVLFIKYCCYSNTMIEFEFLYKKDLVYHICYRKFSQDLMFLFGWETVSGTDYIV